MYEVVVGSSNALGLLRGLILGLRSAHRYGHGRTEPC